MSRPQCWAGRAASWPPRGCRDDPGTMLPPTVAAPSFPPSPFPEHPGMPGGYSYKVLRDGFNKAASAHQIPEIDTHTLRRNTNRSTCHGQSSQNDIQIQGSMRSHPARARGIHLGHMTLPCQWVDLDAECPQLDHCLGRSFS